MHSIIFISILPANDFAFSNTLLKSIRENFPKLSVFDFDNHSDSLVVNYAIEFIEKAESPIIVIECMADEQANFRAFFNALVKKKKEVEIMVKGNNSLLDKFIKPFPKKTLGFKANEDVIKHLTKISMDQNI